MIPFTQENVLLVRKKLWGHSVSNDYVDNYKISKNECWDSFRSMLWDWERESFEKILKDLEFQLKLEETLK